MRTHRTDPQASDRPSEAALSLVRGLPRDQALGLRLIALARTASALHAAGATYGPAVDEDAPALTLSQASGLLTQGQGGTR